MLPRSWKRFSQALDSIASRFGTRGGQERFFECLLIVVCIGLTALLHEVNGYKMVVLNLFYLPIVLAAFYLGRLRAGTLALFCVLLATVVAVRDLSAFAVNTTPLVIGLSLTVWAAVMGLNAIIVGTLSDERAHKLADLHDANLGVVEVLAQYLKSSEPVMQDRANRVANLSQAVARQLRLSDQEVDEIRVAAMLKEINHIDVTAQVIHRAFGDLSHDEQVEPHTFQGSDLVESLGTVLASALPLVVSQPDQLAAFFDDRPTADVPFGAAIVHAVYRFDTLMYDADEPLSAVAALKRLESESESESDDGEYHPAVLHALGQVIQDLPSRAVDRVQEVENLVRMEA